MARISKARAPEAAVRAASKDRRIVEIVDYSDVRWVPNSYKWPRPETARVFRRDGAKRWAHVEDREIDGKRSYGSGPQWTGLSERGGRLAGQ